MEKFMEKAIEEGISGVHNGDGGPFGAVVVKYGEIIARGHNMVLQHKDPTAHAEIVAIRKACEVVGHFDLSGCHLFTSCYPCPMCMGAALWARLDRVFYAATPLDAASVGFDDQNFHDFMKSPHGNSRKLLEHLPIKESMEPFTRWAQKDNKQMY